MPNKKRYANRKRKHSQTGNHNDSPIDDGTNITTKEQTICETCLKQFSSLPMHFASNPFCAQSINDLSIVGKVAKKTSKKHKNRYIVVCAFNSGYYQYFSQIFL